MLWASMFGQFLQQSAWQLIDLQQNSSKFLLDSSETLLAFSNHVQGLSVLLTGLPCAVLRGSGPLALGALAMDGTLGLRDASFRAQPGAITNIFASRIGMHWEAVPFLGRSTRPPVRYARHFCSSGGGGGPADWAGLGSTQKSQGGGS